MIWSREEIKKYVENVLPKLERDEVFIMFLYFRNKYIDGQQSENVLVSRKFLRTNDTNTILQKIEKVISQKFFDLKTGKELPDKGKVLYVDPNPKSTIKAYNTFIKEVNNQLYTIIRTLQNNNQPDYTYFRKLDIQLFSCVHRSTSRHIYWLIDIDEKDEDLLNKITELLEKHIKCIIETRGGYHLLINVNNDAGKIIHNQIKDKFEKVEYKKEFANPLPGTLQGGVPVKIKYLYYQDE